MRNGLIIGKFLPPHRGHELLIERGRAQTDRLTVVVCSRADEPIPGALRVAWLEELFPDVAVRHLEAELPQQPHEHPEFWTLWSGSLRRLHPEPLDLIFSSEDYGDELARRLGAHHVLVDRERREAPVSGTHVRADPFAHWQYLSPCVRAHYVRRVVVTGPESTGKTTLARSLAAHFKTVWVPEFARGYLDAKYAGQPPLSPPCREEDIEEIARGQLASEDALARQADRLLICDTDLMLTTYYAEQYFGRCPDWIRREAEARRYALHLLLDTDVPWVADPQRDLPQLRPAFRDRLRADLEAAGRPYVRISGSWDRRWSEAVAPVRAVQSLPGPKGVRE